MGNYSMEVAKDSRSRKLLLLFSYMSLGILHCFDSFQSISKVAYFSMHHLWSVWNMLMVFWLQNPKTLPGSREENIPLEPVNEEWNRPSCLTLISVSVLPAMASCSKRGYNTRLLPIPIVSDPACIPVSSVVLQPGVLSGLAPISLWEECLLLSSAALPSLGCSQRENPNDQGSLSCVSWWGVGVSLLEAAALRCCSLNWERTALHAFPVHKRRSIYVTSWCP